MKKKRSIIWSIEREELQALFDTCDTKCEILRRLGYRNPNTGGNSSTLTARIKADNIDLTKYQENFQKFMKNLSKSRKYSSSISNDSAFTTECRHSRNTVKRYIINNNIIPYICNECGNDGQHNGKKLVLQLEHINGVNDDNRLENLCFLCPNCHSQTETFGGKNSKIEKPIKAPVKKPVKAPRPLKQKTYETEEQKNKRYESYKKFDVTKEVLELLIQQMSLTAIGKQFGVSDNAIKKRCKRLGIDLSLRRFKSPRK